MILGWSDCTFFFEIFIEAFVHESNDGTSESKSDQVQTLYLVERPLLQKPHRDRKNAQARVALALDANSSM